MIIKIKCNNETIYIRFLIINQTSKVETTTLM